MSSAAVMADSLDGLRLNRALKSGMVRLLSRQEHLNKINVFPVPDDDTCTNLALTMHAVLGTLQRWPDTHAGKTLTRVADAALDGARGNSGAILAQFFLGLCDKLGHLGRLSPDDFADGVHGGAAYARDSLSEPREGTILTVLTDFAREVQTVRRECVRDFRALLHRGVRAAEVSEDELARTRALTETAFVSRLQSVGGFGGKSDQLNNYNVFLGDPGFFSPDLERYRSTGRARVRAAAEAHLDAVHCVTLSAVPAGQRALAAPDSEPVVGT